MDAAQFQLPVRIIPRSGAGVVEIYSAEDALDLLVQWPTQKGPLVEDTVAACLIACAFPSETEDARSSFVSFARASKILAKEEAVMLARATKASKALRG